MQIALIADTAHVVNLPPRVGDTQTSWHVRIDTCKHRRGVLVPVSDLTEDGLCGLARQRLILLLEG